MKRLFLAGLLLVGRPYFTVSVADLSQGRNFHTHVQVTGKVTEIRHERDGDTHMRLEDGQGHFIVAECIPMLPCPFIPRVGESVTVKGISRHDDEHKWYEVHPVEAMQISPLTSGGWWK